MPMIGFGLPVNSVNQEAEVTRMAPSSIRQFVATRFCGEVNAKHDGMRAELGQFAAPGCDDPQGAITLGWFSQFLKHPFGDDAFPAVARFTAIDLDRHQWIGPHHPELRAGPGERVSVVKAGQRDQIGTTVPIVCATGEPGDHRRSQHFLDLIVWQDANHAHGPAYSPSRFFRTIVTNRANRARSSTIATRASGNASRDSFATVSACDGSISRI